MGILLGLFLVAHGLIHLSYLSPAPSPGAGRPEWPFDMAKSWLVTNLGMSAEVIRPLGTLLVVVVAVTLGAAGLATLSVLVPHEWWKTLVLVGAVVSAVTLAIFFHPWIVLGFVIDGVLLGWPSASIPARDASSPGVMRVALASAKARRLDDFVAQIQAADARSFRLRARPCSWPGSASCATFVSRTDCSPSGCRRPRRGWFPASAKAEVRRPCPTFTGAWSRPG